MNSRSTYKTRQRERLLAYLETVPGKHVTAGDICAHFQSTDCAIGQTTVYRQLERLVAEGLVKKYVIDANSPACYEYQHSGHSCVEESCFHCNCETCGRLIHLHCEEMAGIAAHLKEEHGFTLDPLRTVFYGVCECCANAKEKNFIE